MIKRKITKTIVEKMLKDGASLRSIAKYFGVTYPSLQYHRRKWGCQLLRKAHTKGSAHSCWKGGSYVSRGYKMVLAAHRKSANPYTAEHIVIAEKILGRQLIKHKEVVHHLNGDGLDNRPENLFVCSKSVHRMLHRQLELIGYLLIKQGSIVFDGEKYVLN